MTVSVLMPAFNTEPYIAEAITSVLAQSYKQWELIVVDDGSTDHTSQVVEHFMPGRDITLIRHPKNLGLPSAYVTGIRACRGPVITVLDSDDMLLPHSLATGVQPFADKNTGYVWTNFQFPNRKIGWCGPLPKGYDLWSALCMKGWWNACHQRFFSKPWFLKSRGFDLSIPYATDLQVAVLLGETGCKSQFINRVTYIYRYPRRGSISTTSKQRQTGCAAEIRKRSRKHMGR